MVLSRVASRLAVVALIVLPGAPAVLSAPGQVLSHQKISSTEGGLAGPLDNGDWFGFACAPIGDLDNDGVQDMAVGARHDDDGGQDRGAVWILFLNGDGTVKAEQKISSTAGGFTGTLDNGDDFGFAVVGLGDFDGDTVEDIAVGAPNDDDGGTSRGAVWMLLLNDDGTVKSHQKISALEGGFTGVLHNSDGFGQALALLGDVDGDGVDDLAVGADGDDGAGSSRGAIWILFLNANATVKSHLKISENQGGFTGSLDDGDEFGCSIARLGDLDGDGVDDLAVGALGDGDGGEAYHGAVWILFMNGDGTVDSHQKISSTEGGFTGDLDADFFGASAAALDDLDGDGVGDLAVGAFFDDDGGTDRGAVWVLFLNDDGTVKAHQKISSTEGEFNGALDDADRFGISTASLGDLNGSGGGDLAVGAWFDGDGGSARGAVWVLFLDGAAPCPWDCGDGDGIVGIVDFLAVLGQWGTVSAPCDFDGGGVGITDFLKLLGSWGPCP